MAYGFWVCCASPRRSLTTVIERLASYYCKIRHLNLSIVIHKVFTSKDTHVGKTQDLLPLDISSKKQSGCYPVMTPLLVFY